MGALHTHGVATISRLLKIIGLFCRISSLLWGSFANETYKIKKIILLRSLLMVATPSDMSDGYSTYTHILFKCVMSHIFYPNVSCHTYGIWLCHITHLTYVCRSYPIRMSHGTHVPFEWVMAHMYPSNESCHTCTLRMSHVTHITYKWVTSQIFHMNASRHTCNGWMSHITHILVVDHVETVLGSI